ncbi:MAG: hypothetical protein M1812_001374 [Candelaria pacifica]|nr:MAG: hypothetical protein M1812_001374 [Candelaria pacifica]
MASNALAREALRSALTSLQEIVHSMEWAKLTSKTMRDAMPATTERIARSSIAVEFIGLAQALRTEVDEKTARRFPMVFRSENVPEVIRQRNEAVHHYVSLVEKHVVPWDTTFYKTIKDTLPTLREDILATLKVLEDERKDAFAMKRATDHGDGTNKEDEQRFSSRSRMPPSEPPFSKR